MPLGNVLSVIILNWNGEKLLREFLPSVIANTRGPEVEVIVADNGSTDDSLKVMCEEFPNVKILTFDENLGFSGGYNRAIQRWSRNTWCFSIPMWRLLLTGGSRCWSSCKHILKREPASRRFYPTVGRICLNMPGQPADCSTDMVILIAEVACLIE